VDRELLRCPSSWYAAAAPKIDTRMRPQPAASGTPASRNEVVVGDKGKKDKDKGEKQKKEKQEQEARKKQDKQPKRPGGAGS
jgi:hypothetical protein